MAVTARLPVRITVGDGEPVDLGVWELDITKPVPGRAEFAQMLRQAADEIAPAPAETRG